MTRWIDFAPESEIKEGGHKALALEGLPIAVFKVQGDYYAIQNRCTHEDYPLLEGQIEDLVITCPLHGAKFSLTSGAVLAPPAFEDLPVYNTRVVNGMIQIEFIEIDGR